MASAIDIINGIKNGTITSREQAILFYKRAGNLIPEIAGDYWDTYFYTHTLPPPIKIPSGGSSIVGSLINDDYTANESSKGVILVNSKTTGNLEVSSDIDWFNIQLQAGFVYIFELTGVNGNGGTLASVPYLRLYDSTSSHYLISSAYSGGVNDNPRITYTPKVSGNYYLGVSDLYDTGTGTYTLNAGSAGSNNSDDYTDDVATKGTVSIASLITGSIEVISDIDWFKVKLQSGTDYAFELKGAASNGGTLNSTPYLRLYDSSGSHYFISSAYTGGTNGNPRIIYSPTVSGDYFLSVSDLYNKGVGTYTLTAVSGSIAVLTNHAPTGKPLEFNAGNEDTIYTINSSDLLNGFTDTDGDSFSVTNLTTTHGKITLNTDGTWLLTPDKDFNGSLQLSYVVNDDKGGAVNASFNFVLNPVNDSPIGKSTITFEAGTEDLTTFTLKDSDYFLGFSDPDGDQLQGINIKAPNVAVSRNTDGIWSLKPNANFYGTVSLTYDVIDNKGGSIGATINFVVKPANDSPTGDVIITGKGWKEGNTLNASNTLTDVDGIGTITYQWLSNGSAISGANQTTYILGSNDIGKIISVKAYYTDSGGTAESVVSGSITAILPMANSSPIGDVTITGTAIQNQTLTANNTLADLDGLGTITYQWIRDEIAISNATKSTYTLTQADVGKKIIVRASYTDALGASENVNSAATTNVSNVNDALTGSVAISGTAAKNQTLTASNTLADLDGLGVISYSWLREGVAINTATQSIYKLTQADVGKTISVKAGYTDAFGTAESAVSLATASVVNVNDLPTGSVTIIGTSTQNQTLTASNTLADTDGLGTVTYSWLRDDVAITNATQSTYTLTQTDVGKKISVKAGYTDNAGTSESVTSIATSSVTNVNDAPKGDVIITGTVTQNQTLTANNTLTDIDGLGSISYQWLSNNKEISNASQSTYKPTQSDVGNVISVKASYTDGFGSKETVTSAATAKIGNVNDAPTGAVSILGTAAQNQILTASNTLADTDGLGTISYLWLREGVAITGATKTTYTLTQADVGKTIAVKASYIDSLGYSESMSSSATAIVADANDAPTGTVKITGTAIKGNTLTASNDLTDLDGLGTISYQWLNNGAAILDANQSTYKLTQADTGQNISVNANYVDLQNTPESVFSSKTHVASNALPMGTITIKGLATWGTTLSVTSTIKDKDGLGKLSYSWQNSSGELSSSPTYTLVEDDIDTQVWLTVHYTDKKGNIEEVASKSVDVTISTKPSAVNDILSGTDKADKLLGLAGNDTLIGGLGSDKLTGGKGSDIFAFSNSDFYIKNSDGNLVFNKAIDTITDFNLKEHDLLDFGDLGELTFYPTLSAAQVDMALLFYVKATGRIYLNTNDTDGFTPSAIIIISGKPAINTDMSDWNYPA